MPTTATHSAQSLAGLAILGMTDSAQLWELSGRGNDTPEGRAAARLALACAMHVETIDREERAAASTLAILTGRVADETAAGTAGRARDAHAVANAAATYADKCARLTASVDAFTDTARALADLLGR